jgi:hypothetical protein
MEVIHDAAGLIFNLNAFGRTISFTLCRKADLVEEAYIRRGTSKDDFSYMSLKNLVEKKGFESIRSFYGPLWADASHSDLMLEAAEWLSMVHGIEELPFYQKHFEHLVA